MKYFASSEIYQSSKAGSFVIPKIRHKPDYCSLLIFSNQYAVIKINFLLWFSDASKKQYAPRLRCFFAAELFSVAKMKEKVLLFGIQIFFLFFCVLLTHFYATVSSFCVIVDWRITHKKMHFLLITLYGLWLLAVSFGDSDAFRQASGTIHNKERRKTELCYFCFTFYLKIQKERKII